MTLCCENGLNMECISAFVEKAIQFKQKRYYEIKINSTIVSFETC